MYDHFLKIRQQSTNSKIHKIPKKKKNHTLVYMLSYRTRSTALLLEKYCRILADNRMELFLLSVQSNVGKSMYLPYKTVWKLTQYYSFPLILKLKLSSSSLLYDVYILTNTKFCYLL